MRRELAAALANNSQNGALCFCMRPLQFTQSAQWSCHCPHCMMHADGEIGRGPTEEAAHADWVERERRA
jgi:hypothetical protein